MSLDNETEVEAFAYTIDDPNRQFPSILISPLYDGYIVDIEKVRFLVEGLADVIQIPVGADTFHIAKVLGNQYAAWRGAVNIILPLVKSYRRKFVPTIRLLAEDLQNMSLEGIEPEKEILSLLTHRVNLPNSWRQITIEKVMDLNRRRELAHIRTQVAETGETEKYIALLEEDSKEQDQKVSDLQRETESLQTELELIQGELSDKNRQLEFEKKNLLQLFPALDNNLPGSPVQIFLITFEISSSTLIQRILRQKTLYKFF